MKHLEDLIVGVIGATPRSFDGKTYYRQNFVHEGKFQSFKSQEDRTGSAAVVTFLAKGQPVLNGAPGQVITDDCFVLKMYIDKASVDTAKAAKAALTLEDLA